MHSLFNVTSEHIWFWLHIVAVKLLVGCSCGNPIVLPTVEHIEHIWRTSGAHQRPGASETTMGTYYF